MDRSSQGGTETAAGDVFLDGAEMAEAIERFDWSKTPLGTADSWSPALRMMVRFLVASGFPMLLWWGPDYVCLYNDAYRSILGTKHPWALGRPVNEVWKEIWPVLQPLIDTPFHGGPATWNDDILLEINRAGFLEETHFTIAYSAVPDEAVLGGIGGVLATVHEITGKVVADRRVAVLRDLATHAVDAKTAAEACAIAAKTLERHPNDVPFALVYLLSADRETAQLAATAGVEGGEPVRVSLASNEFGDGTWPLGETLLSERSRTVTRVAERFGCQPPAGPWSDPPDTAVVLLIPSRQPRHPAGFLVAGVSSRLALDDRYLDFLELVASQIAMGIANAREHEEERRRAEALAEIDRAKSTFFSNVSHEFRTPLTLLLSPLEEALSDGSDLTGGPQRERIVTAHRNGLRLLKLVNNLLDFARVDVANLATELQPTDLATVTTDLVSVFRSAFDVAGVQLLTAIEPVGLLDVDVDMWETTVLNLVSNALKYTMAGSVRVELRRRDDLVELSVADTGVGISPAEHERVFERFFRSSNEAGRSFEGTGIGLALVSELVRVNGGSIDLDSKPGSGSTFTVTLPARESESQGTRGAFPRRSAVRSQAFASEVDRWVDDAAVESAADEAEAGRATVLVVDDNSDMRRYLRSLLDPEWRVTMASTGGEALRIALRERPDLVLSDVMMPGTDGLQLLDRLRADPVFANIPVLLLSGRAGSEATIDGLARGADDYLPKPFSAGELRARVRALLQASERSSRATTEALAARRRAEELAALSEALHPARTLQAIVDALAGWLHRVVGAHLVTLSMAEPSEAMLRRYFGGAAVPPSVVARYLRTPLDEDTHSTRAVRDGVTMLYEDLEAQARDFPAVRGELNTLGIEAVAVMPLRRGSAAPFAALAIGWDRRVHFDQALTAELDDVGAVVTAVAERAQLLELERSAIRRLEENLLSIDSRSTKVIVRARHQGADASLDVGGDWYDAVDRADGSVAVAVGDVVGRGLDATRTATRLRGALDLAALEAQEPTEALTMLNRYAATLHGAAGTTVVLADVKPLDAAVSYVCAGHPPPLLVSPEGEVTYLEQGRSCFLGVDPASPRSSMGQSAFAPGSTLLLFTDGLIERRRESLDVGLDRLARVVAEHWNLPLRRLEQMVFANLVGDGAEDDVALIAVRSVGVSRHLFCDAFTASRDEQQPARNRQRDWLVGAGIPSDHRDAIILAVGEAVSNAIEHGSNNDPTQVVTVELAARGELLTASVGDHGHWVPGLEGVLAGRGRGHLIMQTLCDDIDIDVDNGGTLVTLQFSGQPAQ